MIKNIVFDWSGVIVNNMEAVHLAAKAVFRAHGLAEPPWMN